MRRKFVGYLVVIMIIFIMASLYMFWSIVTTDFFRLGVSILLYILTSVLVYMIPTTD
jgi:hypothetical protein